MKYIFFLSFILFANLCSAQNIVNSNTNHQNIESDKLIISDDNNTLEFLGKVNFSDNKLQIFDADKIIFLRDKNQLQIFSQNEILINGPIQVSANIKTPTLIYNITEQSVLVK